MTALALLLAMVPIQALQGWVLSVLWAWFLVPLGLTPLPVVSAIGLSMIAHLLFGDGYDPDSYSSKHPGEYIAYNVLYALLGLAVGGFWSLFR